jgi:chorismate mutase
MTTRGVRGATTVLQNDAQDILQATQVLIENLLVENPTMETDDIASVLFTVTKDIDAAFPAKAARILGWYNVPLICGTEIPVPESLPLCIRILISWNTNLPQAEIVHVYLEEALSLQIELNQAKQKSR